MAKKKALIINEEDYPSNSDVSRMAPIREDRPSVKEQTTETQEEPKKAVRLPRGHVIQRKKTLVQSIAETLVGNTDNIGSYILHEVLVPAFKSTVKEMITSGIEMILGETTSRGSSKRPERERSSINYGSFSKRREEGRRSVSRRDRFELGDIYFKDHSDAEDILDRLCERLEDYDEVSVGEFYDMANIDRGHNWALDKYGWTNLKKAFLTHTRYGYSIVLPEPEELE